MKLDCITTVEFGSVVNERTRQGEARRHEIGLYHH